MTARTALPTTPRRRRPVLLALVYCQLALLVSTDASLEQALQPAQELSPESFLKGGDFGSHPVPRPAHLAFDAYELPPTMEEQYDDELTALAVDGEAGGVASEGGKQMGSFPPAAAALIMQLHNQQQQQRHQQQQHQQQQQQQHQQQQMHVQHKQQQQQQPRRHCSIEITSTVSGHCQHLKPIGAACVSGEYMDVLNAECM